MPGNNGGLLQRLVRLVPVLLIGMLIMGQMMFAAGVLVPALRTYGEYDARVNAAREQIASMDPADDESDVLQLQVESARGDVREATGFLLASYQSEQMIDRLYLYAGASGVSITNLQAQTAPEIESGDYEVMGFRLQVEGPMHNLLRFMANMREGSATSVIFSNVDIRSAPDGYALITDLAVYSSPLADGMVLDSLPNYALPVIAPAATAPVVTESVQQVPPPAPDTTSAGASAVTTMIEAPAAAPMTASAMAAAPLLQSACEGAPTTLLAVGGAAIVDFTTDTTLNLLTGPRTEQNQVSVVLQVRDGARLQIINGPVCGSWNGFDVWYWETSYNGVTAWVGEATREDRWLCPETNPDCSMRN